MSFRTTSLLFGILIAMLLVFGLAVYVPRNPADVGRLFPSIAEVPSLDVSTVVLDRAGKVTRLVKTEPGWRLEVPPITQTARADATKVEQIIDQVRGARKVEEAVVTQDRAKAGLGPPRMTITLKEKGAGREWTLNVGNQSEDKLNVYVTSSERPRQVLAVPVSSLDSLFFKDANELRARTLLDITEANTTSLGLSAPAGKDKKETTAVALAKDSGGLWVFKVPAGYGAADFAGDRARKDPGVKGLVDGLGNVRVEDVKDFEPLGRPLAGYGLAEGQEALRITAEHTPGLGGGAKAIQETLLVGSKVKEQYYVRMKGDESVARVSAKKLEPAFRVAHDPQILRSRDLTSVERAAVDVIGVRWGAGLKSAMQLRRPDPTLWKLYADGKSYKANPVAVSGDRDSLLTALRGQGKVEKFFDASSEAEAKKLDEKLGFNAPAAEVKLYADALEKVEEKAKKAKEPAEHGLRKGATPVVTLLFGKTDKDQVYVKRVTEKFGASRVSVPASVLDKVTPPQGALAYLDTSLPSFKEEEVVQLELDRPGGKFVVERSPAEKGKKAKKAPAWRLVEPKDLPGRTAVSESDVITVLETLAHLQVEKWVRKVDAKDAKALAELGLGPAGLSATVTVKQGDKTEGFVYRFGKESGDANAPGVYALLNKIEIVFLAQPAAVKALREAELRDRTVFSFDPTKVKELKMVGWYETAKYQFTLLLERKSGDTWEAPNLKGFDLNSTTVGDFVRDLSHLKAKQLIAFKAKAPAEHKLAPDDKNLRVDVKLEDGKTTYTLTIGALNKDKTGYYATASTLPDVVFLLPQDEWERILSSYSYFSHTKQAAR